MNLPGFITRNLKLKVGSALLAVIFWAGVVYAANPPQERTVAVPVPQQAAAIPAGYQLVRPIGDLSVRIGGPRSSLDAFAISAITVTVDWRAVRRPGTQQLPVTLTNSDSQVELIDPPTSVAADLDSISSLTVPVTIKFSNLPPAGYVISGQSASPSSVVITGPAHELPGLQVVVTVDLANRKTNFDADLQPYIYDSHGNQVGDVGMTPSGVIHVTITVSSAEATRAVVVVPRLVGSVAPGYELAGVSTGPLTVVLSGPEDLLNGLDSVSTQSIPLTGLSGSVVRVVGLALPAGVTASPATVTVTLYLEALPRASPTPSPSPSPAPT